jgi:hypothetical protein
MQRQFEIFTKPSTASIAVKQGFSWLGFFLVWIWALSRGLWFAGSIILAADALIIFLKYTFLSDNPFLCGLLALGLRLAVGIKGNFWRSKKLENTGYIFKG